MISKSRKIISVAIILAIGAFWPAYGQAPSLSEYSVKAAFLYNFAKFVEWPECPTCDPPNTFVIGILGEDPFGREIAVIEGKDLKGLPLSIKRLEEITDLKDCKVLFISASMESRLPQLLSRLTGQAILTVADAEGFAQAGVMINLYKVKNKIRFQINPRAAEAAGLKISSHLLRLAEIVSEEDS